MADPLRVANCSGFYGDRLAAAREMLDGGPIDVLTGDWLAELTMLIPARNRQQDPTVMVASSRLDSQAKSLGEWLRARVVDLPEVLML